MEREATAITFSFIPDRTEFAIWPNSDTAYRPAVVTYAVRFRHLFKGAHLPYTETFTSYKYLRDF